MRQQHYIFTGRMIPTVPKVQMQCCDVINSQPTGSIAANCKNFTGDLFIHNTLAVKAGHVSNEVSRALGTSYVSEYV